jgi:hypothetical protein
MAYSVCAIESRQESADVVAVKGDVVDNHVECTAAEDGAEPREIAAVGLDGRRTPAFSER